MKKILAQCLIALFCFGIGNATTFYYYVSSGEVIDTNAETNRDHIYIAPLYGAVVDPTAPDGNEFLSPDGKLRVLNYSKIYTGSEVRNATQEEIDGFAPSAQDDRNQQIADKVTDSLLNNPEVRILVAALIKGIIKEDNENRATLNAILDSIANATSLANFQSLAGAIERPTNREFEDTKTYIINQISKDD